jgi:hypothetical protein
MFSVEVFSVTEQEVEQPGSFHLILIGGVFEMKD